MYRRYEKIHFVGIGGSGMSGIAELLKNLNYEVSGSDLRDSETTRRLRKLGITIYIGHESKNITGADIVVMSSAVSPDNPEVIAARETSLPVIPRAEMLAELARLKYGILVAGTHGKTTTTSLIASVLAAGGVDPTVIIGGKLKGIGSNAMLGAGEFLVAEADESDGSFLRLAPSISVVTNIDREHMEFFREMKALKNAFLEFINKVPFYGLSILCGDDIHIRELLPEVQRRCITYGLGAGLNLVANNIRTEGLKSVFEAFLHESHLGTFEVPMIGEHNVCNSLAAIAVSHELGIGMETVREALRSFSGVQRRFEVKGSVAGIWVIDDYGHHPTEISATLRALKAAGIGKRLIVLFQPHRYSRTRDLMSDFFGVFGDADKVILMNIFPAGEVPLKGITSEVLLIGIRNAGADVELVIDRSEVLDCLKRELKEGDILLTLGAGDVWKVGEAFMQLAEKGH
jgi:UDP-N-acetylmuramate--alanine ligase